MADNGATAQRAEQDFSYYYQTLGPNEVIFPGSIGSTARQYGVTVHRPACQWEIVAVESGRRRHVAFVAAVYGLDQVLGLACGIGRELPAV